MLQQTEERSIERTVNRAVEGKRLTRAEASEILEPLLKNDTATVNFSLGNGNESLELFYKLARLDSVETFRAEDLERIEAPGGKRRDFDLKGYHPASQLRQR